MEAAAAVTEAEAERGTTEPAPGDTPAAVVAAPAPQAAEVEEPAVAADGPAAAEAPAAQPAESGQPATAPADELAGAGLMAVELQEAPAPVQQQLAAEPATEQELAAPAPAAAAPAAVAGPSGRAPRAPAGAAAADTPGATVQAANELLQEIRAVLLNQPDGEWRCRQRASCRQLGVQQRWQVGCALDAAASAACPLPPASAPTPPLPLPWHPARCRRQQPGHAAARGRLGGRPAGAVGGRRGAAARGHRRGGRHGLRQVLAPQRAAGGGGVPAAERHARVHGVRGGGLALLQLALRGGDRVHERGARGERWARACTHALAPQGGRLHARAGRARATHAAARRGLQGRPQRPPPRRPAAPAAPPPPAPPQGEWRQQVERLWGDLQGEDGEPRVRACVRMGGLAVARAGAPADGVSCVQAPASCRAPALVPALLPLRTRAPAT